MTILGGIGLVLLLVALAGATWFGITKSRGLRSWGDGDRGGSGDLAMPCAHTTRRLSVTMLRPDALRIQAACAACGVDTCDDLAVSIESDGRVVVENRTERDFAIVIDGELHNLVPATRKLSASHVVRPRMSRQQRPRFILDDEGDKIL